MLVYTDCPLVEVEGRPEPQPRGFVLSALRKPPCPTVQKVIRRVLFFLLALPTLTLNHPLCGVQVMNSVAVFPMELVFLFFSSTWRGTFRFKEKKTNVALLELGLLKNKIN